MPRPKLPPHLRRSSIMRLGLTPAESADVRRRALASGMGVEDFVRQTVLAGLNDAPPQLPTLSSWTTPEQADDAKPALLDARVQEVQAALDAVAEPLPTAAAPIAQPTPCPKCNGAGRIGTPPVRFRCPVCAGSGKASLDTSKGDRHASP